MNWFTDMRKKAESLAGRPRPTKHLMFDLETWGTDPGFAVRSIGAVIFDPFSEGWTDAFYRNIDTMSCVEEGLRIDPRTSKWWDDQSADAKAELETNQRPIREVIGDFHNWLYDHDPSAVWSHGACFDEPIWRVAVHACGLDIVWHHHSVRDTRTLYALAGFDPKTLSFAGKKHYALDDARFQAVCVQEATKQLRSEYL